MGHPSHLSLLPVLLIAARGEINHRYLNWLRCGDSPGGLGGRRREGKWGKMGALRQWGDEGVWGLRKGGNPCNEVSWGGGFISV